MADELKKDHIIRRCVAEFGLDDDGRSVAEIKMLIMSIDPSQVTKAGSAYVHAYEKLQKLQGSIETTATEMAKVWEGASSVEAQQALRTLHATIRELGTRLLQMGRPLEALGKRLGEHKDYIENSPFLSWATNYSTWDDSSAGSFHTMDKGMEWGSQDELAGQHLRLLNNDLWKTFNDLPMTVHKELPDIKAPGYTPPTVTDTTYDPTAKGGPDVTGVDPGGEFQSANFDDIGKDGPGGPDVPGNLGDDITGGKYPDGTFPDGTNPGGNGPSGSGSDGGYPNGRDPNAGAPNGAPNGGVAGSPNAGDTPGVPDPRADTSGTEPRTDLSEYRPTEYHPMTSNPTPNPTTTPGGPGHPGSTGTVSPGVGGAFNTAGSLPLNARSASSTASGMPMLPLNTNSAGAKEGDESEASTWLLEEDDVWGADTDGTVKDRVG
ncbi:hypothetical protein OIE66_34930 [Nonomuraea sp. NBC_01738]|uniref:WXG100 family type VII secretion target n=1 Tax=Nonomuraea sp. NBC_01738 TaxID=2976003 RepID=UPI002E10D47D|nr:hypothetical protein OIE66_34930 [Nonomuraea sp. NBC_01738]